MRRWLYRIKNEPYVMALMGFYVGERLFGPGPMKHARMSDKLHRHLLIHNTGNKRRHIKARA